MGLPAECGVSELKLNYRAVASCVALLLLLTLSSAAGAQESSSRNAPADSDRQLLLQMQEELRQTRAELARAQARIEQLNHRVEVLGGYMGVSHQDPRHAAAGAQYGLPTPADAAKQQGDPMAEVSTGDDEMLRAQIEEQSQTKVESASKYRVKVSGLILMNAFSNSRGVNQIDVPGSAQQQQDNGSFGATLRQSIIGLQVFGPVVAGARTSGLVSVDFYGGFPVRSYATTAGVIRLREAAAHLDWRNTSLVVGQEQPFISPLSPTSYASLAEPAMSWSGNLWTWTPQVIAEHRFNASDSSYLAVSGGIMAPISESVLLPPKVEDIGYAAGPGPGERNRRPAFASSVAWHSQGFGQPMQFGVGGFHSYQHYDFGRGTDSWAVTAWWQIPLTARFELSGEAYRGLAVGGLGGGMWQSAIYNGDPENPATAFRGLNAAGGWAQLKFRPRPRWETNLALGQDNVLARDLRWAPVLESQFASSPLARNRTAFANVIFRPRSNLVLSGEYRRFWTYSYIGPVAMANQINLAAGISF